MKTEDVNGITQPEFDNQVNLIGSKVEQLAEVINRIENIILVPRPCDVTENCKQALPGTVSQALSVIVDDVTSQNKRLENIAGTLNRYFGELKLD